MARRLIWSPRALSELRAILTFIDKDSPANARAVLRRIRGRVSTLPDQPGQGRVVPELKGQAPFREVFVHKWRIIYRTKDEAVEIVAIVHGARLLRNVPPLAPN